MSEMETHSREELEEMSRLPLRKLAKKRGMSAEEAAKSHSDALITHILEAQGDDGGSSKGKTSKVKSRSSKESTKGKESNGQSGRARRAPGRGKKTTTSRAKKDDEGNSTEASSNEGSALDLKDIIERLDAIGEEQDKINKKIDKLGKVFTENNEAHVETINELRADAYITKELVVHLGTALDVADAIDDNSWPDELDMNGKAQALEEEVGEGNERGDDD